MSNHYVELPSGTVLETESPALWPEGKRLSKADGAARLRKEAIDSLREMIHPGDTIYCVLRHVSKSGMFRRISLEVMVDNQPRNIDGYAARLGLADQRDEKEGLGVSGCGMDMGFSLVYNLGRVLFPDFDCIGEKCPSNDHFNGDRNRRPHKHSDGGYALRHAWI